MKGKMFLSMFGFVLIFSWLTVFVSMPLFPGEKEMTVSAVGDCLISNKVSFIKDPGFLKLVELLKGTDCTYGNCETTFFNPGDGFPAYKDFDPNVYCEPWGADELKWMGFDLMSLANNHIMDFDYPGLFATIKHLDRVGIDYAGAGKDLEQASRHGLFETEAGPVSLISCVSWLPERNHKASLPHPYMKGRPGHNGISTDLSVQIDKEKMAQLRVLRDQIVYELGESIPEEEKEKELKEKKLRFGDLKFSEGEKSELMLIPNEKDLERIIQTIKVAKRNSRLVLISLHEHLGRGKGNTLPSRFEEKFARSCIDAGADMFIGTGSHQLWGIEIYKGKPIFYSLGNFFFQGPLRVISPEAFQRFGFAPDTKDPTLYEEKFAEYFKSNVYWESVVPLVTFDGQNKVKEIALYPIELNQEAPWHRRGAPRLADKKTGQNIIKRLNEFSKTYNTSIVFKDGVGKVIL